MISDYSLFRKNKQEKTCIKCGECCYLIALITPEEDERLADDLAGRYPWCGGSIVAMKREGSDGPCVCLGEDNKCTIYDERPSVCVNFEPGQDNRCALHKYYTPR